MSDLLKSDNHVYFYKDRPYRIVCESKIKIDDAWIPCTIYECLYNNPDGDIWVRFKDSFQSLFKKSDAIYEENDSVY